MYGFEMLMTYLAVGFMIGVLIGFLLGSGGTGKRKEAKPKPKKTNKPKK